MRTYEDHFFALIAGHADALIAEDLSLLSQTSEKPISRAASRRISLRLSGKEPKASSNRSLRRTLLIAALVALLLLALCLSVSGIREGIWKVVTDLIGPNAGLEYRFSSDRSEKQSLSVYREPTLAPAETEKVVAIQNDYCYTLFYIRGEDRVLTYIQTLIEDDAPFVIDGDPHTTTEFVIGDREISLLSYEEGVNSVLWTDEEAVYFITAESCFLSAEELLAIAESVQ